MFLTLNIKNEHSTGSNIVSITNNQQVATTTADIAIVSKAFCYANSALLSNTIQKHISKTLRIKRESIFFASKGNLSSFLIKWLIFDFNGYFTI